MSEQSKIFIDRNRISSPFHIERKPFYQDHISNLPLEDLLDEYSGEVVHKVLSELLKKFMVLSVDRITITDLRFNGVLDNDIKHEFKELGIKVML